MSRTIKKEKTGGKRVSSHCQNNGVCDWCRGNRTIRTKKEELRVNLKAELEHQIHMSHDMLESVYPEIYKADMSIRPYYEDEYISWEDYTRYSIEHNEQETLSSSSTDSQA